MKKQCMLVFILFSSSLLHGMGGFNRAAFGAKPGAEPTKPASKPPITLKEGTPLEKELIALGNEFKAIAEELTKALDAKEVKQEIDKKRAAIAKKPAQAGYRGGGYKPGSFRPSSFGGSSGGRSSFGGGGSSYKPSFGGSSFGRFGGLGGFGGSRGSSFGKSSPSSSFGSSGSSSPSFSSFGSSGSKSSGLGGSDSSFPSSSSSSGPKFSSGAHSEASSLEKATRTKLANQHTSYVDKLEKAIGTVTKEENAKVRETKLENINLEELNRLFEEVDADHQRLEKTDIAALEAEPTWKAAAEKLKIVKNQALPILVELMVPLTTKGLAKIDPARKTFEQLGMAAIIAPQDLQTLAARRCQVVAQRFTVQAQGKGDDARRKIGEELEHIADLFPGDLLGSPTPQILTDTVARLKA
jgi:hypothetical protein